MGDLLTSNDLISDGPAKSFAFRRLRYLDSSWQMYILLNEFQEMADSKVAIIPLTTVHALTVSFCLSVSPIVTFTMCARWILTFIIHPA
jgi:hypothetical protein